MTNRLPKALRKRKQLHQSSIETHSTCSVRFEFRYVKGIKLPPRAFLIRGSAIDKAVDADLTEKIKHGILLPVDIVSDIAAEYVEKEGPTIEPLDEEERAKGKQALIAETKDNAVRLARLHHREVAPGLKPTHVQRRFALDLDSWLRDRAKRLHAEADEIGGRAGKIIEGRAIALNVAASEGLDLAGAIDIREEIETPGMPDAWDRTGVHIRDTKTSAKSPADQVAAESDQLTMYALAEKVLGGTLPRRLFLDYLVLTKEPKVVIRETTRNDDDLEVLFNRITAVLHSVHTGVFIPAKATDWQCSQKWCGYFDICPYAKRPKSTAAPSVNLIQISPSEE